jgi:outer membrane protein TolC
MVVPKGCLGLRISSVIGLSHNAALREPPFKKMSATWRGNDCFERLDGIWTFVFDGVRARVTGARCRAIGGKHGACRQDELALFLRGELALRPDQAIEVTSEELPGSAEQEGANLIAMASESSPSILLSESDVKGKELRLAGEKRGYWPTVQLVAQYGVLAKFNNYEKYLSNPANFHYNNLNAGVNIQMPIFSARTRASIELAQVNLDAAKINLDGKRIQVSADVRLKSRRVQEADATKEVARLELQLSQQNLAVVQSQFSEGKLNLRDVERARLDENEKRMKYLDSGFERQQAQLELLRMAGQLDRILE